MSASDLSDSNSTSSKYEDSLISVRAYNYPPTNGTMRTIQMARVNMTLSLQHSHNTLRQAKSTSSIKGSPETLQPQVNQINLHKVDSQNFHLEFTLQNTPQCLDLQINQINSQKWPFKISTQNLPSKILPNIWTPNPIKLICKKWPLKISTHDFLSKILHSIWTPNQSH